MPNPSTRQFLEAACQQYQDDLVTNPEAVEYLSMRGLSPDSVTSFRLGFVGNPLPGHEMYAGKLAIPYLTQSGVTTLRFRRIGDGEGAKYLSAAGDEPRIYNANALTVETHGIAICEGEFDTITASQCGIPAIGIAGVSGWRGYFRRCFKGYRNVFILADNDDKGQGLEFAEKVASQVENPKIILMPTGHDVNSFVLAHGPSALMDKITGRKTE